MEAENTVCPVCTLYLRPGITLKAHLASHPKQKVIDALVNLSIKNENDKQVAVIDNSPVPPQTANFEFVASNNINCPPWPTQFASMPTAATNHAIIYQQFMSTTSQPPPTPPIPQQYLIPTMLNPQQLMTCQPPYMYQQQLIMSAGMAVPTSVPTVITRKPQITDVTADDDLQCVEEIKSSFEPKDEECEDEKQDVIVIDSDCCADIECREQSDLVNENRAFEATRDDIETVSVDKEELEYEEMDEKAMSYECCEDDKCELDKACQTAPASCCNDLTENENSNLSLSDNNDDERDENGPVYYELSRNGDEEESDMVCEIAQESDDINYSSPNQTLNITIHQTESAPNASDDQVIDIDGMQLVLCNDFMSRQMISQVDDFECMNSRNERTVLMNIGGMGGENEDCGYGGASSMEQLADESISRESITNMSIRADEHMPPRGELSGQESNEGESDVAWSRMQYESNSSTSCDLLARESWEGSDCSDIDVPPLQSRDPPQHTYMDEDEPEIAVNVPPKSPLIYKCLMCEEGFGCPKERRVHQCEVHAEKMQIRTNVEATIAMSTTACVETVIKNTENIGSRLKNKKPVKKLIIKPKVEVTSEPNFDNIFTPKLKHDDTDMINKIVKTEGENRASVIASTHDNNMEDSKENGFGTVIPCTLCTLSFLDHLSLKKHMQQMHEKLNSGVIRFRCDTCGENMMNENKYNEHLKVHPLECHICGKYFYRRQNLQLHLKRHLGIKPYACEYCKKTFLTKQKLDEHKNTHTGNAPIKCNMCDETFRRHSNLVQHRNRHHLKLKQKVKDYVCFCGEVLHSKKKFAWHKEIHETKPKACMHCSEKFIHMASLTRHMRRAHNDRFVPSQNREDENVECPICKGIYLKASLEVHIRTHSGVRPFSCAICSKDFTTKWNLKLHKWTHAGRALKPFKCEQCSGAFIREADYVAHMNSHKSVRPYTCNYCGAQFIRKYNCQRHVKEHEKEKPFTCTECGKAFHRSYYLKDHLRIHSGVRPYSCHICGKTSTTKSNHNKHVMIHHAKEPVSTEN